MRPRGTPERSRGTAAGGIRRKERDELHDGDEKRVSADSRITLVGLPTGDITILGTLKGLVSEGEMVKDAFEISEPDVIGIHIGKEEISGLKAVVNGEVENAYLSSYEKVYARELSEFGEVQIPPPSLVKAYEIATNKNVPVRALDFDEEKYSAVYTELIDGMTLIRQSLRLKRINRRKFKMVTPEDFILEWDRVVNKFKGFRRLEDRREKRMAQRIRSLSKKFGNVLAIVEFERMEGIIRNLSME